jgi:hypothetical protein
MGFKNEDNDRAKKLKKSTLMKFKVKLSQIKQTLLQKLKINFPIDF